MKKIRIKPLNRTQPGVLFQLLLSHVFAAGLALLVSDNKLWSSSTNNATSETRGWVILIGALAVAGGVGILSSLNLQLGLQALELRLDQLIATLKCSPLTPFESRWLQPGGLLAKTVLLSTHLSKLAEEKHTADELKASWQLNNIQTTQQETRRNLAALLHDTLKQQIHFISIAAATAQLRLDNDPQGTKIALDQVRRYAREAVHQADTLIKDLEPALSIQGGDLLQVIAEESHKLENYSGAVEVIREVPQTLPVATTIQAGLARIVQLATANIIRHAQATQVRFKLQLSEQMLQLEVSDNGRGFDVSGTPGNSGLANSRFEVFKLGGELKLVSSPGGGTNLLISVPLSDPLEISYRTSAIGLFKQWQQRLTSLRTLAGLALELSLLLMALLVRVLGQENTTPVAASWSEGLLLGVLSFGVVVSLGFGLYCFLQSFSQVGKVDQTLATTPSALAWKQRNHYYMLAIFCLFALAVMPLAILRFPNWPGLDQPPGGTASTSFGMGSGTVLFVTGSSFLFSLGTLLAFWQVYRYRQRYYDQLWPAELDYELNSASKNHSFQLKTCLYFLVVAAIYLVGIGFDVPPTAWQWLTLYSLMVFGGMVVSLIVKHQLLIKRRLSFEVAKARQESNQAKNNQQEEE